MQHTTKLTSAAALALATALPATAQEETLELQLAGTYPAATTMLGPAQERIASNIEALSGGTLDVTLYEPGALLPPSEYFNAISSGALDAAFSDSLHWTGQDIAFALFTSVPFGPAAGEYLAWMRQGGGENLMQEMFAQYDIYATVCSLISPEGGGWFREEIESVDDLQGLRFRIGGLGGNVMEKLGVSTQLLSGGEVLQALQLGTIDAAEFSMPAIDASLGFQTVADYYYFPAWQSQSSISILMIGTEKWESLSDNQRNAIDATCAANTLHMLAEGEALQVEALTQLEEDGVQLRRFPDPVLDALRESWAEVAAEQAESSEWFARVWESYSTFRDEYATWGDMGYLD